MITNREVWDDYKVIIITRPRCFSIKEVIKIGLGFSVKEWSMLYET